MSLWGDEHFHFLNGFMSFFYKVSQNLQTCLFTHFVTHWHLFTVQEDWVLHIWTHLLYIAKSDAQI